MPYKVVEKRTRWCTNWAIFKYHMLEDGTPEEYAKGLKFKKEHPEYFPRYLKDSIVEAAPGSLGIMCFPEKLYALWFMEGLRCRDRLTIIKVEGLGLARPVCKVIQSCGYRPWYLVTKARCWSFTIEAPEGTVAFSKVKVLE